MTKRDTTGDTTDDTTGDTTGYFIVVEGIDGAGTTTQAKQLVAWLEGRGLTAHLDREPTDAPIGRLLRQILRGELQPGGDQREAIIALLFAADRLDHVGRIQERVAQGHVVVSDRYLPSSLAYQSVFCGLDWVQTINTHAIAPDLSVFLDVPPEIALARVGSRDEKKERYEELSTLTRVDTAYRAWIANADQERLCIIDGTEAVDMIAERMRAEVAGLMDGTSPRPDGSHEL